jgi:hypothetical protein
MSIDKALPADASPAAPSVVESPEVTLIGASGKVWVYVPTGRLSKSGKKLYFALGITPEHTLEFASELVQMAALVREGGGCEAASVAMNLSKGEKIQ